MSLTCHGRAAGLAAVSELCILRKYRLLRLLSERTLTLTLTQSHSH